MRNGPRSLSADLYSAVLGLFSALLRPFAYRSAGDPYHVIFRRFVARVDALQQPNVLEIGSRSLAGVPRARPFAGPLDVVGFDVQPGVGVDVVGDAHELSTYFPPSTFDAVYSISVFEHLLMPWKVVLEANRLLKQGGLMFTATHPAWPAHELPADFWRFQKASFHALFNPKTGFEILELSEGLPARMISLVDDKPTRRIYRTGCSMGVSAIARKIADYDPSLAWPVRMDDFSDLLYPQLREDQLART